MGGSRSASQTTPSHWLLGRAVTSQALSIKTVTEKGYFYFYVAKGHVFSDHSNNIRLFTRVTQL